MTRRSPFQIAVLTLIWGWLLVLVLAPNLLVFLASFATRDSTDFIRWEFSFTSYLRLVDPLYWQVFWQSLLIALWTTLACLLIGYPFAYAMSRCSPNTKLILLLLLMVPFWTNSLVRTFAMKSLLATRGVLNEGLLAVGLIDTPLRMLYTQGAVIAGLVYILLPFMILPLYAVFEQLRRDLIEASADLGGRRWQTFSYVVLPLTLPGIIAGCLLVFLPALGMFYVADVLGGSKILLAGNVIKNQFLDARDWPFGSAASVVLTGIMGLMLWCYFLSARYANRRVD